MKEIIDGLNNVSLKYNNSFSKKIFDGISSSKNIDELNNYFLRLKRLLDKLTLDKSKPLTQSELNIIDRKIEIVKEYIDTYNELSKVKEEPPVQTKIKQVENKEKEFIEQELKPMKPEQNNIDVNYGNSDIQFLQDIENKLLLLKSRLSMIEADSEDAINIRIEINKLSDQRLSIIEKYSENGISISRQLDSLEYRYVSLNNVSKTKPRTIGTDEYLSELKETINKISDLSFNHLKSRYLEFDPSDSDKQKEDMYMHELNTSKKRYFDLIYSLHGTYSLVLSEPNEPIITTEKLLSYLTLFNVNNDYSDYKNYKVGSDAIGKQEFNDWSKKITTFTNSLFNKSKIALLNKSNKVEIQDAYANKDGVLDTINSMLNEVYLDISKGEKHVYR